MKHSVLENVCLCGKVAPFVGAWIETYEYVYQDGEGQVAPFVGAWIETITMYSIESGISVAPFVGAWIETDCSRR